jgi:hypothetical protein
MADDPDEKTPRLRRSSSVPPPLSIPEEESTEGDTITALVTSNPLANLNAAAPPSTATNSLPSRIRRRSSVSILQALVNASHLLPTHDARQR